MSSLAKEWVLVRGLLRSRFHWKSFGNDLQQNLGIEKIHYVELAGNGFLSDQLTPLKIDDAVTHLRSQLPSDLKRYGILGISLGGMLAAHWARNFSSEVQQLVLINSSSRLSPFHKRLIPSNYFSILKLLAQSEEAASEEFILSATSNFKDKWQPHLQENIEYLRKHPIKTQNLVRQLLLSTQADFKIVPKCPKLILCSTADRLVHYSCSEKIAQLWNCPIEKHTSAGHDLPLDDADWVVRQIQNFKH